MPFWRRTVTHMDRDALMALIADIVLEQGGDWDATFHVLRNQLPAPDVEQGEMFACTILTIYEEPGLGPRSVEMMRDRRRRIIPAAPVQPSRGFGFNGWGATG